MKDSFIEKKTFSYHSRINSSIVIKKKYIPAQNIQQYLRKYLLLYPMQFGYFSYTFVQYQEPTVINKHYSSSFPDACFMAPGILFIEDIALQKLSVQITYRNLAEKKHFDEIIAMILQNIRLAQFPLQNSRPLITLSPLQYHFPYKQYLKAVSRAKMFLYEGESYQIKLSQKMSCQFKGNPFQIYQKLRKINPSPYNSVVSLGNAIIISNSPEQLLEVRGDVAITKPIAGTYPKNSFLQEEQKELVKSLFLADQKELAEHIMLVDLERNDLGKVCSFGSVRVTKMMDIEEYSHLFHIVSTIEGNLAQDKNGVYNDAYDAFFALFPGGTITGCPKKRTMEIISQLEPCSRGIYTGNIGYFFNDGVRFTEAQFSIAIRSLFFNKILDHNYLLPHYLLSFHVGGGIVADSNSKREYDETMWKAFALLESIGFKKRGVKKRGFKK